MEAVENRMVVDWQWLEVPPEVKEKLNRAGYKEIGTGIFVPKEDAFDYAMERISHDAELEQEFQDAIVEWFYSGNWIKED